DATEALAAMADGAGGLQAQSCNGVSAPTPTTGPLALHPVADEVEVTEDEDHRRPWWLIILVLLAVLGLVAAALLVLQPWDREPARSEERRVGRECRPRMTQMHRRERR